MVDGSSHWAALAGLVDASAMGTGDDRLLGIASKHSRHIEVIKSFSLIFCDC
jgi:hypothetical protein